MTELPELENPDLVAAMRAVAQEDTPDNRQRLYEALLESMVILPTPESPEDDEVAAELQPLAENEDVSLLTFEDDTGAELLIAFTDEDAALAWEPEGLPYIALRGFHLMMLAAQNDIDRVVLNPISPESQRFERDEILSLAQGELSVPESAPQSPGSPGVTVLISEPEEEPTVEWREALAEILANYPSVESAYFFQLHIAPHGARHVLGLVLYEGMSTDAEERLMESMVSEFEELLPEDQSFDLVVLDEPDFLQTVRDTVSAAYGQS